MKTQYFEKHFSISIGRHETSQSPAADCSMRGAKPEDLLNSIILQAAPPSLVRPPPLLWATGEDF